MVTDGEIFVVRLERVCRSTEYDTTVVGVGHSSKEVSIIAYSKWQVCLDVFERDQGLLL